MNYDNYKYSAFISYSHTDSKWAEWLHRSLEKYSIPKSLQKDKNFSLPKSLYPIFRDREELPSASALAEHITRALIDSRYLIVICSPRSAQSEWVNEEVRTFKSLGREDRVLCLIVDGEPFAGGPVEQTSEECAHPLRRASDIKNLNTQKSSQKLHFSGAAKKQKGQECFPLAVRYNIGADKQILSVRAEPIAADVREGKDGKALALSKLIAGILDIDLALLTQRQNQRRINRLRLFAVLMLVLVTAFASIALEAWMAQKKAEELSLVALSRQLSTNADSLFDSDRSLRLNMLLAGVQAHSLAPTVEAKSASLKILLATRSIKSILSAESAVMNIAYSADGKLLAAATDDSQILLWDLDKNTLYCEPLIGHEGSVLSVAFSPDGTLLISGGVDATVIVWDMTTVQPKFTSLIAHNDWVVSVDFAPNGKSFVTSGWDGRVIIWDTSTLKPLIELPLGKRGWASSIEFSPDGNWVAIGREDGSVEIWDVVTSALSGEILIGHVGWVTDVSFSHNNKYLASASSDGTIQIWDLETRQPRYVASPEHSQGITSVTFSPDDQTLITGGWDRKVHMWDVESGVMHTESLNGHTEQVTSVAVNPDGKTFASAGHEGTIVIWETSPTYPYKRHRCSHNNSVNSLKFNPSGNKIASSSTNNELLLCSLTNDVEPLRKTKRMIKSLAFSPDGQRLALTSNEYTIFQYNPNSLTPITESINLFPNVITSLAYSPDNRFIAIGDRNSNIHLWRLEPAQHVTTLVGHQGPILGLDFSSDGQTLASASEDSQVYLWDINDGDATKLGILHGHSTPVTAIAFQPTPNNILASGSEDGVLIFWDTFKAEPIGAPIIAHDGAINSLSFSTDGMLVATGGSDMQISLRDARTHKQVGPKLEVHTDQVTALSFSPNSYTLASGSADGSVYIWDLDIENWKKNICKKTVKQLTPREWELYIGELFPYRNECRATQNISQ